MQKQNKFMLLLFFCCLVGNTVNAQTEVKAIPAKMTEEQRVKSDADQEAKAGEWITSLNLSDAAKETKVKAAIVAHLKAVRDWHNEHPHTTVPAGINPANGNRLSDLDRQIIANSAMPKTVHEDLMKVLKAELTPEQVEAVLDKYTIGKVAFTLQGYKAIVPDLTAEEEAKIVGFLKGAREQAIDYKNMNQISAIFEIYKTKCEQYLNSNGRNWRELFKSYSDKRKREKEAEKNKQ